MSGALKRRTVLRVLAQGCAIPALARLGAEPLLAAAHSAHGRIQEVGGAYVFRTLDPHQTRTVTAIVDQIIPETDTPGAVGVHVHEFIDLMLTEVLTPEDRARLLQGLAELDAKSRREQGGAFVDLGKDRQLALLEALQREADEYERAKPGPREMIWGTPTAPREHFLHAIKWLTLFGYYTSEVGLIGEREFSIVPGWQPECETT